MKKTTVLLAFLFAMIVVTGCGDGTLLQKLQIAEDGPKPNIYSLRSYDFLSGEEGHFVVGFKNAGNQLGDFMLSVNCGDTITQVGDPIVFNSLQPGVNNIERLSVTATVDEDTEKLCTITLADKNNPSNVDSKKTWITAYTTTACAPDEEKCEGQILKVCNADGTGWTEVQSDKCKDQPTIDGWFKPMTIGGWLFIAGLVVLVLTKLFPIAIPLMILGIIMWLLGYIGII